MVITVSGASGFIGRRLASRLHDENPLDDCQVLVKADEDDFCRSGLEELMKRGMQPMPIDLIKGVGFNRLKNPNVLFHLAANTHTWETDHACNDGGTRNLLRSLGELGNKTHIVFTSTTAVMDNRISFAEPLKPCPTVERRPFSRYGQSKWRAEQFLRAEAVRLGFPLSIVRLCTVYGPQPRPNTLFDVLKREVSKGTVAARLNWPALTSFIHVDDVVSCLIRIGADSPAPGEVRTHLLATESKTLAEVSCLVHKAQGITYRMIRLPQRLWRVLRNVHLVCSRSAGALPARAFNALWRFNMVVNPVFHCDTTLMKGWFPTLQPRLMADCIQEI